MLKKVYGVKFRSSLQLVYYDFGEVECVLRDFVICKTKNGLEYGQVHCIKEAQQINAIIQQTDESSGFVRIATEGDKKRNQKNLEYEKKAVSVATDCIRKHRLEMKIVMVVSSFDRTKLLILFVSEGRVDFRALVRDLAVVFKARVELRKIGIRDEAKLVGGIGLCGRIFCCSSYLNEFDHVSIKMAKTQNLSLNPRKISGCCGRLMCCLQHEQQTYVGLSKTTPGVGDKVLTSEGEGVVVSRNLFLGECKIKIDHGLGSTVKVFNTQHIKKLNEK